MDKVKTIYKQLTALAFQESIPFCYGCYIKAPTGRCNKCGSDDLMRLVDGVGCEYGTEWVIDEILKKHLEPVNQGEAFESIVEDCYPEETKVAWIELDTIDILKTICPGDWEYAQDEYIYNLEQDEEIMSFDSGSTYFWTYDIEDLIKKKLKKEVS